MDNSWNRKSEEAAATIAHHLRAIGARTGYHVPQDDIQHACDLLVAAAVEAVKASIEEGAAKATIEAKVKK